MFRKLRNAIHLLTVRIEIMSQLSDDLTAATNASVAATEALIAKVADLTTQLAAANSANDPALAGAAQSAVDALNAETAKATG